MKKIKYFITVAVTVVALASCGGSGEHKHKDGDKHEHHDGDGHDHSKHEHKEGGDEHAHKLKEVSLNDGQKWKSDSTTYVAYSQMQDLMKAFAEKEDDKKVYSDLAMMLGAQTDVTITSCSMTGPSHDNLHHVLEPLLGEITSLKTSDATKSKELVTKIELLIKQYFDHFEL